MLPASAQVPLSSRADRIDSSQSSLGHWLEDEQELPCFRYTGALPWVARRPDGQPAHLHEDPYFLLGNHRFTLFAHVSGAYQLFTTQRGFALVNLERPGVGAAGAGVQLRGGRPVELTGLQGLAADPKRCERTFGCGFAQWRWDGVAGLDVTRRLSVKPSDTSGAGPAVALLDVTLRNPTARLLNGTYTEWFVVRYATTFHLSRPGRERVLHYRVVTQRSGGLLLARVEPRTTDLSIIEPREQPCRYDLHPPAVVFGAPGGGDLHLRRRRVCDHGEHLEAAVRFTLAPGETRRFRLVVGLVHGPEAPTALDAVTALAAAPLPPVPLAARPSGAFGAEWRAQVPRLRDEPDAALRREMQWHAAMLLALVKYHELYDGVFVPQSGGYDYLIGFSAAPRDFAQHLLPLCRLAPEFARSALLVQFRRMQSDGSWAWSEVGAGWQTDFQWTSSDFQLYAMLALAEYLDSTGDQDILAASAGGAEAPGVLLLDRLAAAFRYLRDEVSVGAHGLVRLLGGDWNDSVCYDRPIGSIYWGAESTLNSALALEVMRRLPHHLKQWAAAKPGETAARARRLAAGMRRFRAAQRVALLREWGPRSFPPRFLISEDERIGRESLYLEPVGLLLRQPDLPLARRRRLLRETERRLARGEPIGLRCREEIDRNPAAHFLPGCQENGGIWWALVGSTIWGAAAIEPAWARRTLAHTTLAAFARVYPDYWLGHWTSADCFNSQAAAAPGLGYDHNDFARCAAFTSHVHAWLLFCHQTLRD